MKRRKYFFKKFLGYLALLFVSVLFSAASLRAMDITSTNFIIRDPIVGTGGGYGSSSNFELISAGNTTLSGVGTSTSFQTRYGFLYYSATSTLSTITFDIDTATSDTETSTPYSVALGTLTTGSVTRSNGSVNSIWVDLDTNATSGAVVTVASALLKSASVPGDTISSSTTTMSAGTENYGLCVVASPSAVSGTVNRVSPYDGTCVDGAVNGVGIIDATSRSILNSGGAGVTTGRAQIRVNAAISPVTPAHSDYTDTLTFIATGTF
jgi:hypothetical protein